MYQEFFPGTTLLEERPNADRNCCLRIGSYIVIRYVLEEYQLPKMLFKRLGPNAGIFLDLTAFSVVDKG